MLITDVCASHVANRSYLYSVEHGFLLLAHLQTRQEGPWRLLDPQTSANGKVTKYPHAHSSSALQLRGVTSTSAQISINRRHFYCQWEDSLVFSVLYNFKWNICRC